MEHVAWVSSVLASATFHAEQVSLNIPLPGQGTIMRLYINPSTRQITADVCQNEKITYSGVIAAEMARPMCPVFKH